MGVHGVVSKGGYSPTKIEEFLARAAAPPAPREVVHEKKPRPRRKGSPAPQSRIGRVAVIQSVVAQFYGLDVDEMLSPRRQPHIVRPRHVAMYLSLRLAPKVNYPQVGRVFERDHTTVMHAEKRVRARMDTDPEFADEVRKLSARCCVVLEELEKRRKAQMERAFT